MATIEATSGSNFNENKVKHFTADDVRFTTKASTLYAIVRGAPTTTVSIRALGTLAGLLSVPIGGVRLLESEEMLQWSQTAQALNIEVPCSVPNNTTVDFKITPAADQDDPPAALPQDSVHPFRAIGS